MDELNLSHRALLNKSKEELIGLVEALCAERRASVPDETRDSLVAVGYRRLFDESVLPMSIVDSNGIFRNVNRAFCELTGFEEGEIVGEAVAKLTHEDDLAELEILKKALNGEGQVPTLIEKKLLHRNGSYLYCRFKRLQVRDADGVVRLMVTQIVDLTQQKHQTRELGRQRSLFEAVFHDMPDALMFANPDRTIRMYNPAFASLLGYTLYELEGRSTSVLYADPSDFDLQGRTGFNVNAAKRLEPIASRFRRKDGSEFLGEVVSTVVRDEGGQVLGYMGLVRDVSERDEAQRRLRESEQRFRDFSLAAADRFWETDTEGRYTYISPSSRRFPNSEEILIGNFQWKSDAFDADQESYRQVLDLIDRREPFRNFQYSIADGKGGRRYRRSSGVPIFDENGVFSGYRGVAVDETGEVLARREAESSSTRFRAAIENSGVGFALWSADRRFIACNDFYRDYTQCPETLTPGAHYEDFLRLRAARIGPDRNIEPETWIADRVADFDSPGAYHEYRDPDGSWYRITKQRLPNGDCLFFLADISEEKRREEELIQARLQAESASRAKSEFLSNVSHELRTPLNAILGFAQIFERASPTMGQDKLVRFGGIIRENGVYLMDLINSILDLSAIEAGRISLNEQTVSLASVAHEALQLVRLRAGEDDIDLVNHIGSSAPDVIADRVKLKQVLVNLLTNAIKFTPGGGQVELTHGLCSEGGISIVVRDTGIGMTESEIAIALEKFGRVERPHRAARDGIGLGLPLAKELVEAHGGTLKLDSVPNGGTTVTVTLPEERVEF